MGDLEQLVEQRLEFADNRKLADMLGAYDSTLVAVESQLGVKALRRGNQVTVQGEEGAVARACEALNALYARIEAGRAVEPGDVAAALRAPQLAAAQARAADQPDLFGGGRVEIHTRKKTVEPRTEAQRAYARALFSHELVFGIGPAGTGKTYLAVAAAVSMFIEGRVDKIILSRPAVEAGERLGFLPGDMKEKIDPYLRPLYDAIHDMLPGRQLQKEMESGAVEVAPLAFMRGRTLSNAFVVLDEAQNTTEMQMKMFLTRLGEGSRMAITGDPTQVDLPRGVNSGLVEAARVLNGVKGMAFCHFGAADVVRHPLVARIVEAYDRASAR
ncbi:PhoH family protein [Rubrimonas cliftonensis]|uniref:PhoH-like protein n=1 Tax=Rubrimonas cliftonensis TaxID=89524 RepID=A0A1H4DXC5_9RHOB|nr:PhoH family protein [Rubrimonas cliftonensis]SEA77443.1 phosphate starvation-inducible protein PhoH [Rubrimonas cliftonensis]